MWPTDGGEDANATRLRPGWRRRNGALELPPLG